MDDLIDMVTDAFASDTPPPQVELLQKEDSTPTGRDSLTTPHTSINPWDPRLVMDLAIGVDGLDEILPRYTITEQEFEILSNTQAFRRDLALAMRDARENGLPFANKAKVQAESYLDVLDDLVYNIGTPANVRLEAIRSIVKWGRLEPQKDNTADVANATQINVNISF